MGRWLVIALVALAMSFAPSVGAWCHPQYLTCPAKVRDNLSSGTVQATASLSIPEGTYNSPLTAKINDVGTVSVALALANATPNTTVSTTLTIFTPKDLLWKNGTSAAPDVNHPPAAVVNFPFKISPGTAGSHVTLLVNLTAGGGSTSTAVLGFEVAPNPVPPSRSFLPAGGLAAALAVLAGGALVQRREPKR